MEVKKDMTMADLPITFPAKYLGSCRAPGSWGVKVIRKPIDLLVETVKSSGQKMPPVEIQVFGDRLEVKQLIKVGDDVCVSYKIETITYGVQDLQYSRIFCMIVTDATAKSGEQFTLHAFVCPAKTIAQNITFAIGAAFKHLAEMMKTKADEAARLKQVIQLKQEANEDSEDDSEAEA